MSRERSRGRSLFNSIYYTIKPTIPRSLQVILRRLVVSLSVRKYQDIWPINPKIAAAPKGWKGWPDNKKFAFVLTHDVDTARGEDRCLELMQLDIRAGFRSAFYFVPGRVGRSTRILPELKKNGFEIGVHDLFHDGKLFKSRKIFLERAAIINRYLSKWGAVGFRAGSMHHKFDWIHDLNILYDASSFDTDPFEPQPDGLANIFPFAMECPITGKRYIELPYTLPQDFLLFVIMRQKNIDIWKKKLDWVAENGGMALVITHPDYMHFERNRSAGEEYCVDFYVEFLEYAKNKYGHLFWQALPSDIAQYIAPTIQA
jgi:hypothetical protein